MRPVKLKTQLPTTGISFTVANHNYGKNQWKDRSKQSGSKSTDHNWQKCPFPLVDIYWLREVYMVSHVIERHNVRWCYVNCYMIHYTQKDGATCCILGRSTYQPQIYSVCMGIWWQMTFFKKLNCILNNI